MSDLRENLGWIVGSAIAGIVAFLSWFYESGLLSTLIGIVIGAGIAYFVQTKTQNRAWKREYGVKIAEEVYGNLFKEMKNIIRLLEEKYDTHWISFDKWKEFQQDHRYFMVDKVFRARLDDFSDKLDEYSKVAVKMGSDIRKIIFEETDRVFGIKTNQVPQAEVTYMKGYTRSATFPDLVQCLVSETYPAFLPKKLDSEASDMEFILRVTSIDGHKTIQIAYSSNYEDFWQTCLGRMKENETYRFLVEENSKILEDARRLREEIVKRIEEPWKI